MTYFKGFTSSEGTNGLKAECLRLGRGVIKLRDCCWFGLFMDFVDQNKNTQYHLLYLLMIKCVSFMTVVSLCYNCFLFIF